MSVLPTLLVEHPLFLEHLVPPGHPERPARLIAIAEKLAQPRFAELVREQANAVDHASLVAVHPERYVSAIAAATPADGLSRIDADTFLSPHSFEAATLAAGAVCGAIDAIVAGRATNAFCSVRPPGHHAEAELAMGFCFFNNAAIGARHAQRVHGAERVAIIDWDVHHGNGTQAIFWDDPTVLYASTHQWPLFPSTGAESETGAGNIFNVPLRAGTRGPAFRAAFASRILPVVAKFRPDFVIISAGFDAHWRDPLADLALNEDDFAWATMETMAVADQTCGGRVVSTLEGGYDLEGLSDSAAAHVAALASAA